MINHVNQLGKADGQPSILMFSDHQGNPVRDMQPPVDSKTPTEIPGVQPTPPPTTKMMEQNTLEEPTIYMEDPKNLAAPAPSLKDEDSTPLAAPDEAQVEDSIQSEVDTTMADPKPEDPDPDLVIQSNPANDLNSDDKIQHPHCSS